MESGERAGTIVLNLMDGRERFFALAPEKAVVAAFEESDAGGKSAHRSLHPRLHPEFKEYTLGYSCGDWIAYKENREMQ